MQLIWPARHAARSGGWAEIHGLFYAAAAKLGARNVRVFGSVARGEDTATSDVDLLVDLDDGVGLLALAGLRSELSELLRVEVDVVPASTLKAGLRDEVLSEAITL